MSPLKCSACSHSSFLGRVVLYLSTDMISNRLKVSRLFRERVIHLHLSFPPLNSSPATPTFNYRLRLPPTKSDKPTILGPTNTKQNISTWTSLQAFITQTISQGCSSRMGDPESNTAVIEAASNLTTPSAEGTPASGGRPECFRSTPQEVFFVLTATMAMGMSPFLLGLCTVITSQIGRDLDMTSAEITWISAASS
jgi:hypothetical protein